MNFHVNLLPNPRSFSLFSLILQSIIPASASALHECGSLLLSLCSSAQKLRLCMSNSCQLGQLGLLPKRRHDRENMQQQNSNNGEQVNRAQRAAWTWYYAKKSSQYAKWQKSSRRRCLQPIWRSCCWCGCHLDKHRVVAEEYKILSVLLSLGSALEMESNAAQPLRLLVVPTQQITCKLDGKVWKASWAKL